MWIRAMNPQHYLDGCEEETKLDAGGEGGWWGLRLLRRWIQIVSINFPLLEAESSLQILMPPGSSLFLITVYWQA